jgi:hypothetical protein
VQKLRTTESREMALNTKALKAALAASTPMADDSREAQ